jgi:hypothetical protein
MLGRSEEVGRVRLVRVGAQQSRLMITAGVYASNNHIDTELQTPGKALSELRQGPPDLTLAKNAIGRPAFVECMGGAGDLPNSFRKLRLGVTHGQVVETGMRLSTVSPRSKKACSHPSILGQPR